MTQCHPGPSARAVVLIASLAVAGCSQPPAPSGRGDVYKYDPVSGVVASVGIPEGEVPVLTKAFCDRLQPGMGQDEALNMLRSSNKLLQGADNLAKIAHRDPKKGELPYEMTITEGQRTLKLRFHHQKLVDKELTGTE